MMKATFLSFLAQSARLGRGVVPAAELVIEYSLGPRGMPGLAPAGDSLSLASPRESKQREGEPDSSALRARCDARRSRGLAKLASLKQRQPLSGCTCASRLLITAWAPNTNTENRRPQGRAMARPCGVLHSGCLDFVLWTSPSVCAEQRSRERGRLFFGDFLLAKQKKVTAQSGAHPDTAAHSAQDQINPPRPPGRDPACPAGRTHCKTAPSAAGTTSRQRRAIGARPDPQSC